MDGEAGWWTTSGNIGPPPLARVMGVGRQQQVTGSWLCNIGGVDWKGLADSGKIVFKGEGADVPEEVPMDEMEITNF